MPTPSQTMIPVTIQTTEWIKFSGTQESIIYLPRNIPAGHSATLPGRIKAFIKNRESSQQFEPPFCTTDTVSLTAIMPGLDMELPGFASEKKTIQISYPLELKLENNLRTVSQGSSSMFSWNVCLPQRLLFLTLLRIWLNPRSTTTVQRYMERAVL